MFNRKKQEIDFACQSSGNCCRHFIINLTHLDIARILANRPDLKPKDFVEFVPADKNEEAESFIGTSGKMTLSLKKQSGKPDCLFLNESNRCGIHDFKPLVCRAWPFSIEKGTITWIKEHRSFIRKLCHYHYLKNANDPELLKKQLRQHYREQKLFIKLIRQWNALKEKEIDDNELFHNILNEDFLNFILKVIAEQKLLTEVQSFSHDKLFNKIFTNLVKNKDIEAILSIPSRDFLRKKRKADLTLHLYLKSTKLNMFLRAENLKALQERLQARYYYFHHKTCTFYLEQQFLILYIYSVEDIVNKTMPFDTKILYNPAGLDFKLSSFEEQKNKELKKIFYNFWFKLFEAMAYIKDYNFLSSRILINDIVQKELLAMLYWLNQKYFNLLDIAFLENKPDDIVEFLQNYVSYQSTYTEQNELVIALKDIFEKTWQLSGLDVEHEFIKDFRANFHKYIKQK